MKILVLGAGNMGAFFIDTLCLDYEVAVYDTNLERMKYLFRCQRIENVEEIREFNPDLLINAVSLEYTQSAFDTVLPYIPETCIISDITSVKNGLPAYYQTLKHRFVSTHPMFGPTFANIKDLSDQSAVIIKESDPFGKAFFRDFYSRLKINIYEYSFAEHDETIAYSLSIPFVSTMVFGACMKQQEAPGTTFKKHMAIAKGLMSENDYLLSEILFNPYTLPQVENIRDKINSLIDILNSKDTKALHQFLAELRKNIA
ncbi:MAG: prephenate dehydrogenase/arogenate dehydrogenase family protein [Bacteroidota bacterium]|nr:prephenate dehydrogenase/arogenate dehydrogenase family protein [Bacteroidota bacterium]